MKPETTYREVRIIVLDNGYSLYFSEYRGSYGNRSMVAKTPQEIKEIITKHLIEIEK